MPLRPLAFITCSIVLLVGQLSFGFHLDRPLGSRYSLARVFPLALAGPTASKPLFLSFRLRMESACTAFRPQTLVWELIRLRLYLLTHVPDPVALSIRSRLFRSPKGFRHWLYRQRVAYYV